MGASTLNVVSAKFYGQTLEISFDNLIDEASSNLSIDQFTVSNKYASDIVIKDSSIFLTFDIDTVNYLLTNTSLNLKFSQSSYPIDNAIKGIDGSICTSFDSSVDLNSLAFTATNSDIYRSYSESSNTYDTAHDIFVSKSIINSDNNISKYVLTEALELDKLSLVSNADAIYQFSLSTSAGYFSANTNTSNYVLSDNNRVISFNCSKDLFKSYLSNIEYNVDDDFKSNIKSNSGLAALINISATDGTTSTYRKVNIKCEDFESSLFSIGDNEYAYIVGMNNLNKSSFSVQNIDAPHKAEKCFIDNKIVDAEKSSDGDNGNSLLCWAGSLSNMLAWTGYGSKGLSLENSDKVEDKIFDYFTENFYNNGANVPYGLEWFFSGEYNAPSNFAKLRNENSGNKIGFSSEQYAFGKIITPKNLLFTLLSGDGVSISLKSNDSGHAVSCWGVTLNTSYSLDDPRCLTGLYITDSNDGYYYKDSLKSPDRLIYTTVKYNSSSDTYNVIYGSGYYNFVIDNSIYGTAALTALPRIDSNHNANLIVGNYKTKEIINDNVIVNQSGYTSSCTILSSQYLLGKSDNDRITGSQGVQYVLQKGSSYSPEILNKAKQLVSSGGISYSAKVGNGAIQYIYNGGIASSTHILSTGGNQIISSGGVASNTLVEYGSSFSYSGQIVSNGGVAVSSIITNLGGQTIYSGGVGRYTSICGGKQTLYSSAIASDTFIYSGSQFVYSGGYASTTHVFSGGSQVVSSGVAEHTIIHSSGQVSVYAGGVTSNLYVQVGGNESVQSAGLDKNAIVEGSQRIFAGGNVSQAKVLASGSQIVAGRAWQTVVLSGGVQAVISSGKTFSTTISLWGSQTLDSAAIDSQAKIYGMQYVGRSASAISAQVFSGGSQNVYGLASQTSISSGGQVYVYSGGQTSDYIVSVGGNQIVDSDASDHNARIYGSQTISQGGSAISASIGPSGTQNVLGSALATTISSGGLVNVSLGGVTSNIGIGTGASQNILSGGIDHNAIISGVQNVSAGGSAVSANVYALGSQVILGYGLSGTVAGAVSVGEFGVTSEYTVESAGQQFILSAGSDFNSIIYGTQTIEACGTATSAKVEGLGVQNISGQAYGTLVRNGGTVRVLQGGSAIQTTVDSQGHLYVYSSGIATDFSIEKDGQLGVFDQGIAQSGTVNKGGALYVASGGIVSDITVEVGAVQYIASGGVVRGGVLLAGDNKWWSSGEDPLDYNGEIIFGSNDLAAIQVVYGSVSATHVTGIQYIASGGVAHNNQIYNSGTQSVFASGITSFSYIYDDAHQIISSGGYAYGSIVDNNGIICIDNGGLIDSAIVYSLGTMVINNLGSAFSTTISGVQNIYSGGYAYKSLLSSGGIQNVVGIAEYTTIEKSATEYILSGGSAINTIISGEQIISQSGYAAHASIFDGGIQYVSGSSIETTIENNGNGYVFEGGFAFKTLINSGGKLSVYADGLDKKSYINGTENIFAGGSSISPIISKGGILNVSGVANNVIVNKGGLIKVSNTGVVNKAILSNGASMSIAKNAIVSALTLNKNSIVTISNGGHIYGKNTISGGVVSGGSTNDRVILDKKGSMTIGEKTNLGKLHLKISDSELNFTGINTTIGSLNINKNSNIKYDISSISANNSKYILSVLNKNQQKVGKYVITVKKNQNDGIYKLSNNIIQNNNTAYSLYQGTTKVGQIKLNALGIIKDNKMFTVNRSSTQINFMLTKVGGIKKGTTGNNKMSGSSSSEIFYGGKGNDIITGNGGQDVAIYDTISWGKDVINNTSGTMTILFNGVTKSNITTSLKSGKMTIVNKNDKRQTITIKGWKSDTHNIVYGSKLTTFDKFLKTTSPSNNLMTSAKKEVWKKSGLANT